MPFDSPLADTAAVAARLDEPGFKLLDATFFLPNEGKDAVEVYRAGHLPGAAFFDIDAVAMPGAEWPHMFPDAAGFEAAMGALGIEAEDDVICTDQGRVVGACRAWYMLKSFGHRNVAVMDGGLARWRAEGRPVETGAITPEPTTYRAATPNGPGRTVADAEAVLAALDASDTLVLDARSTGRFEGTAPEPRAGLASGHMPGALSLPYDQLLDDDGLFLAAEVLQAKLAALGLGSDSRVIATCGSGVSAAVILFALDLLGHDASRLRLYDGSWSEWGARPELPVVC